MSRLTKPPSTTNRSAEIGYKLLKSLSVYRLNRIINHDDAFWQHACDCLGAPGSIWNELQDQIHNDKNTADTDPDNNESSCLERQKFIWLYKLAHNWFLRRYQFFKYPKLGCDDNLKDTGFSNESQLWGFSDSGKLHRMNLATREIEV